MLTMVKTRPMVLLPLKRSSLSTMDMFQDISFPAILEIEKHMTERKYARRESIFQEDDPAESVWLVQKGHIKEVNHSIDGKDQTISMIGTNGIFGISAFDGGKYGFHSIALTDATVISVPIQAFRVFMAQHSEMARLVVSKISKLLRQSRDRQTFSRECAEKRLLHVLLEMRKEFGDTIPMTHREIASMAGTSPETCSRTFSRLAEAGLITAQHGKFIIKNIESMAERLEEL
jgi:CRP-like cAMP-binding protein